MFHHRSIRIAVAILGAWLWSSPACASTTPSEKLPFRAVVEPGDHFTASDLTDAYEDEFISLTSLVPAPQRLDLDRIESDSEWTQAAADSIAEADSTAMALFGDSRSRDTASLPPEERDALTPATAGVRIGLPGPTAALTALAGGLGLLAKLVYELAR